MSKGLQALAQAAQRIRQLCVRVLGSRLLRLRGTLCVRPPKLRVRDRLDHTAHRCEPRNPADRREKRRVQKRRVLTGSRSSDGGRSSVVTCVTVCVPSLHRPD